MCRGAEHGQVGIAAANFVCGFILVIGSYVMEGLPETQQVQRRLVHIFRCVPPFNLGATAEAVETVSHITLFHSIETSLCGTHLRLQMVVYQSYLFWLYIYSRALLHQLSSN